MAFIFNLRIALVGDRPYLTWPGQQTSSERSRRRPVLGRRGNPLLRYPIPGEANCYFIAILHTVPFPALRFSSGYAPSFSVAARLLRLQSAWMRID